MVSVKYRRVNSNTYPPIILEDMAVLATLRRVSRGRVSTLTAKLSVMYLMASLLAILRPLMIDVGWILRFTSSFALFNIS
jgi:hypothetical protein